MKCAILGAVFGYFSMLVVVAIGASGGTIGEVEVTEAMVFLNGNDFEWRLVVPVIVGLVAGVVLSQDSGRA